LGALQYVEFHFANLTKPENIMPENVESLTVSPTLNPYRGAALLVIKRIGWDLKMESWRSRRKVRNWTNKYKGQKAVILCNGPSLLSTDFRLLEGIFTFGLNKIYLLFDKSKFRPSCIVAVNHFVIEQSTKFYNETGIPLFLDSKALANVKPRDNVIFLHSTKLGGFAKDCSISINQGFTVTYVAMQLAFHMGFEQVALVGCDHSFATDGPANATVISGKTDESHFDPNYFAGGVKWELPDLFESEVAYTRAKNIYNAHGRKLVNATHGGQLDVFDRCSLEEFVGAD
jgi:hypothetical protein